MRACRRLEATEAKTGTMSQLAPASPKFRQTPSRGLERVGWHRENQKLREVGYNAENGRGSFREV